MHTHLKYISHALFIGLLFILSSHLTYAASNNVQYSSVLDYSPTNILLLQQSLTATSTYNCDLNTLVCGPVSSSITNLAPSVLAGQNSYFLSPDNASVLITTYVPNSSPIQKLYAIQNNTLVLKQTLPTLSGLVTKVRWAGNNSILILSESDGSMQKYNANTNSLSTFTSQVPSGAAWISISNDARYIAYYIPATQSRGKHTYGIIDTVADKSYTLDENVNYWDLLSDGVRIFAFSPDSTKLLYLDDTNGYQTLYQLNLSTLSTKGFVGTPLTARKYVMEDMVWENNTTILFSANRDNPMQWSLYEMNITAGIPTKISDWVAYNMAMQKIGSTIVFQTADANGRLTKLFNTVTKKVSTLTIPGVDQSKVGSTNQVVTQDGLYGVWLKPATATDTLVVWLHGGPVRQTSIEYHSYLSYGGYDWVLNQLKASGVSVLKLDYPGSTGYGRLYTESIKGGVGTVDTARSMQAIKDFAAAHGYKNIYVMGNSYGGYLALKLVTSYPDQIKGAYSLSGVTDWAALMTSNPSSIFGTEFNGAPNILNASLYAQASILNNISKLGNQKIILVHGDSDTDVPYAQSSLMNGALVNAGKNVEFLTLPNEDHIYKNPASFTLVCNKALELVGMPASSLCTPN